MVLLGCDTVELLWHVCRVSNELKILYSYGNNKNQNAYDPPGIKRPNGVITLWYREYIHF